MSYSLVPYLIDGKMLRALVGVPDNAIFDRVAAATAEHPQSDGDNLQAARAIIDGNLANSDIDPSFYGYGLELICAGLGSELPVESLCGISTVWLEEDACDIFSALTQDDLPIQLPLSESGFPGMYYLDSAIMNERLAELEGLDPADQDDEVQQATAEFISWLRAGVASGKDLLVFHY